MTYCEVARYGLTAPLIRAGPVASIGAIVGAICNAR
jgi:hypothetical protein